MKLASSVKKVTTSSSLLVSLSQYLIAFLAKSLISSNLLSLLLIKLTNLSLELRKVMLLTRSFSILISLSIKLLASSLNKF